METLTKENQKKLKLLDNLFSDLISEYANFLGKDYFIDNGFNYTTIKPTLAFNYFLILWPNRTTINEKV